MASLIPTDFCKEIEFMTNNTDAFIYDGGRSAFGRHGGKLSSIRPDDLLSHVIKAVVGRNTFAPSSICEGKSSTSK